MRILLITIACFISVQLIGQSSQEQAVLGLSERIFKWEVNNQIDSLQNIFHEKFTVTGSDGSIQQKAAYISRLKSGNFVHNQIDVEESVATVANNTATVVGKGRFSVTVSGKPATLHLSYFEVFTRANEKEGWRVLNMKANVLDH